MDATAEMVGQATAGRTTAVLVTRCCRMRERESVLYHRRSDVQRQTRQPRLSRNVCRSHWMLVNRRLRR